MNSHAPEDYDLPLEVAASIHATARDVALAMKRTYGCDGVSTRQHNEPAGNQEIWHYHLHVFPRFHGDRLYSSSWRVTTAVEHMPYPEPPQEVFDSVADSR